MRLTDTHFLKVQIREGKCKIVKFTCRLMLRSVDPVDKVLCLLGTHELPGENEIALLLFRYAISLEIYLVRR